jgi:mannose-6-phosphate isomerase-like protein (cupin superfamily)
MGYSVVNIDEVEPGGKTGAVRFVRRELGVLAFGINWFELGPNAVGHPHDETSTGQEEVNVVVAGSGTWHVDGDEVPVEPGTFLRFDPEAERYPVAGPDGLTFIAVGAPRGGYEPHGPF